MRASEIIGRGLLETPRPRIREAKQIILFPRIRGLHLLTVVVVLAVVEHQAADQKR